MIATLAPSSRGIAEAVTVVDHPLVQQKLVTLRNKNTPCPEFRRALAELTSLLFYEATRTLLRKTIQVQTPLALASGKVLQRKVVLAPILRAGLGMLDPVLAMIPDAAVGFIGLKRDEATLRPIAYYENLPGDLGNSDVILMDPMLATGGSTVAAVTLLKENGAESIRMINLLAAPEGIATVHEAHPEVAIFTAAIDQHLNERGYIVPGLGDAGDRQFGT